MMRAPASTSDDIAEASGELAADGPTNVAHGVARRSMGVDLISMIAIPVLGLIVALVVGGVFIALIGENPVAVYVDVVDGVFFAPRGLSDTATAATPLLLIALGYSFAYQAPV
jgi:ABC-type uncharacterized transport system permease subunit